MQVIKNDSQNEVWNQFILDGNQDALSKIYFHYYDQLFAYGLKHTSDKQIVEDSIQDVFINFIRVRESIGNVKNLTGYLISSFRRQLFLEVNKQKNTRLTELLPEEHFDYFQSSVDDNSDNENLERIHSTIKQCVSHLTDKQQEIIFLRFESEISYEEISEMLNISVDSCYKSVFRSIKAIRSEVKRILGKGGNVFLWFLSRLVN